MKKLLLLTLITLSSAVNAGPITAWITSGTTALVGTALVGLANCGEGAATAGEALGNSVAGPVGGAVAGTSVRVAQNIGREKSVQWVATIATAMYFAGLAAPLP
jgi:hypothetical protein